jgi:hypothetical protein
VRESKKATMQFTTDKKAIDKAGMRQPRFHELLSEPIGMALLRQPEWRKAADK